MQNVGQTKQNVSKHMNSHKFDIRNFTDPAFATTVHYNSNDHDLNDFSFMPIDIVNDTIDDRLCKKNFWIHKLKTHVPEGFNSKALFTVD